MLHHSTKYQQNSITHFLNMHSTSFIETVNSNLFNNSANCDHQVRSGMQIFQQQSNQNSVNQNFIDLNTRNSNSIDGKSFTIAAILGLNNNNSNSRNFNEVVNLSLNQTSKLFGGLETMPQMYNGGLAATTPDNGSNNGHSFNNGNNHHPSAGHALKSLQQQFSLSTEFVSREKYRNVLDQTSSKKTVLKSKRVRTIFTPEQLERLEAEFERQQYMVGPERLYLAHTLQLTEAQVKVWFQNRRIKWRKCHLELTQQRLAIIRHQQKQLVSETKNTQNVIQENEQQDLRISSISPELTVSDSVGANTESETE